MNETCSYVSAASIQNTLVILKRKIYGQSMMTDSTTVVQNEIEELEKRLIKMDLKLETAKKARDEYVNFLQRKCPSWKPPAMRLYKQQLASDQFQRSILDKLATNKYHWDLGKQLIAPCKEIELSNFEPNDPIPSCGPALEPDLIRIKKRLNEIAEDLENLREHRLHLSTADYYLSLGPELSSKSKQRPWKQSDKSNADDLNSFHELRKKIIQIDPHIVLDTPQPNAEDYEHIRMEYLQGKRGTVDGKKDDNETERNLARSLTDKMKNLSVCSAGNQKELNHLQEGQQIKSNPILGETSHLSQSFLQDAQKGDQKSSQAMIAANSRSMAMESTSQAPHPPDTTDDGFNFLARILGNSADAVANKKPPFTNGSKTIDLDVEDSDSDFFA
ncbi:unnamed protein product [Litomosoides sigmodontis]|uniref:Uncharacterized protein n=1 Tax=Litomosoides sigmodontis TaxID=42156 RepID=A0A3P6T1L7_LITSI|nr:unnamed protein product [Litomosoides sigmodontis]